MYTSRFNTYRVVYKKQPRNDGKDQLTRINGKKKRRRTRN